MISIDLNMDLGEGMVNETKIFPYISSCNIACGGHAGDPESVERMMKLAAQFGVRIGAHPSFPDRDNFGRVVMDLESDALKDSLMEQLQLCKSTASKLNIEVNHVKPHGALYNMAVKDSSIAEVIIVSMLEVLPVALYAPFNSVVASLARDHGIEVVYEGFADRRYNSDLSLVARTKDHALILNENDMFQHVMEMINHARVKTVDGAFQKLEVHTICLHGDSKGSEKLIKTLNLNLKRAGIEVK